MSDFLTFQNGQALSTAAVPVVPVEPFRQAVIGAVMAGRRISALYAEGDGRIVRLTAVLSDGAGGELSVLSCNTGGVYESITPACAAAHWFEREIAEQWLVWPEGHPWLKPIRFQASRVSGVAGNGASAAPPVGVTDFFRMEGQEVHEVAVGPVHAGVIEPGHFRFQCLGETVHHLEISLGYQHRGVERALVGGPGARTIHYVETLAGDTSVGHAAAYARAAESLSGTRVPPRAQAIRGIAAEMERIANHIGDLGALAGDVGFLPTMSYCGRIRGDVLNATAAICGNRFGRGLVVPGGVAHDIEPARRDELLRRLEAVEADATSAVELMFAAPSMLARLEGTGVVSADTAREIGLVGVAARASGLGNDVRAELPYGMYRFVQMPVCTWPSGDCFARAYVRWMEVQQSLAFIREQLASMPEGPIAQEARPPRADSLAVTLVEGWRGEICHVVRTDAEGRIANYKVVDPSFHNWFGLALALRGMQISDFPLCNKSFNLSYCGHDL
jgi:Ni,Fe-hydrogenase III large subunit